MTTRSVEPGITYEEFVELFCLIDDLSADLKKLNLKHRLLYERADRDCLERFFYSPTDSFFGANSFVERFIEEQPEICGNERTMKYVLTEKARGTHEAMCLQNALKKRVTKMQADAHECIVKHDFGKNLEYLLMQKNILKADLAQSLGVSAPTVSHWINGEKLPKTADIEKICVILHCGKSDLLEARCDIPSYEPTETKINISRYRKKLYMIVNSANEDQLKQMLKIAKIVGIQFDDTETE